MKITLLSNHSIANVGDHAILQETLKVLEQTYPGASITLVFNEPESARIVYPQHTVIPSALCLMTGLDSQGNYRLRSRKQRIAFIMRLLSKALIKSRRSTSAIGSHDEAQLFRAIAEADLVLGCGGGYICSDPDEIFGWFTLVMLPFMMAHVLRRPLVLLPQSIGPFKSIRQSLLAYWVIRQAHLVLLREHISLELLKRMGIAQRAMVVPDIAFGMQSGSTETVSRLFEEIGLGDWKQSQLIGITAITWEGQSQTFKQQSSYEAALLGAVNAFTAEGAKVIFFPQCTGPSHAEDDRRVVARIIEQAQYPQRIFQLVIVEPPLLQAAYGMLDFLIGTRMHSVILAANAETASVAIGYQPKTTGVLRDMHLAEYGLQIQSVSSEEIIATAHRLLASDARQHIATYIAKALRFKKVLRELLRGIAS